LLRRGCSVEPDVFSLVWHGCPLNEVGTSRGDCNLPATNCTVIAPM
jgi:hypothetical protein